MVEINAAEFILMLVLLVSLAISIIVISDINVDIFNEFQASEDVSQEGKEVLSSVKSTHKSQMDIMMGIIIIGTMLALVIASLLIGFHPVFLGVTLISLILVLFLSPVIANLFYAFTQEKTTVEQDYPITTTIFNNFPLLVLLTAALVLLFQLMR